LVSPRAASGLVRARRTRCPVAMVVSLHPILWRPSSAPI